MRLEKENQTAIRSKGTRAFDGANRSIKTSESEKQEYLVSQRPESG